MTIDVSGGREQGTTPDITVRILLCHAARLILDGLRNRLSAEADIEIVGMTNSCREALALVRRQRPHVVVTGMELPNSSGADLIRQLADERLDPRPRVVVCTADQDNEEALKEILIAGADGVLTQDAGQDELTSAVRAVAKGQPALAPVVTQLLLYWFRDWGSPAEQSLRSQMTRARLTAREKEVLLLIAEGLSTEEVAEKLFVGVTTVRTHIYRMRSKLQLRDRGQLISFAYRTKLTC
ncbi:MAG: LuxR C-terminal-related transcriptional regulator [Trebonia sp.]